MKKFGIIETWYELLNLEYANKEFAIFVELA